MFVGLRQHGYDMRDVGLDRHRGFPWVEPESSDVRWATRQVGISVVMAGVTDVRRSEWLGICRRSRRKVVLPLSFEKELQLVLHFVNKRVVCTVRTVQGFFLWIGSHEQVHHHFQNVAANYAQLFYEAQASCGC